MAWLRVVALVVNVMMILEVVWVVVSLLIPSVALRHSDLPLSSILYKYILVLKKSEICLSKIIFFPIFIIPS